jgi:hypothetical protein
MSGSGYLLMIVEMVATPIINILLSQLHYSHNYTTLTITLLSQLHYSHNYTTLTITLPPYVNIVLIPCNELITMLSHKKYNSHLYL